MRIAILGATGFIGSRLGQAILDRGDQLFVLTRSVAKGQSMFPTAAVVDWQDDRSVSLALASSEAVVNLAGRSITDPWTKKVKEEIYRSRIDTTKRLVNLLANLDKRPTVLVNASAIGYYGSSLTAQFDENSPKGEGFLADVCADWEASADRATELGIRVVKIRIGIVLDRGGGALGRILPIFQLGLGGVIGSGDQWFSWIHREDLVRLILFAIDRGEVQGVLNGTAPQPVTNREFTEALAIQLQRTALLPVPALALKVVFGEGASILLEGQKVLPRVTTERGFEFTYPTLENALAAVRNCKS
ncbi:MAG: TIGR01777 family oxidoreductase [Pseudanabaenaceae cyanobacterium SKYGB_i_bin29]|nr:TIGR01777 family oxidoreductase [Pseudanabaenaceae cyanobacterium SKYG29]MDW8421012.1 TIGR01777 family oxidoreductase [Pseudanabaenaceae cyanobacterium SKYGB_i_bin29]